MQKQWCFCTLALGEPYWNLTEQLARDLQKFAPDTTLLVLTDNGARFAHAANVRAVQHRKRSVLGYNDKLCVVKRGLDEFDTVIFIDADTRILGPVEIGPEVFKPGLRAFLVRAWSHMQETYDKSAKAPAWQKNDLRMMGILKEKLRLPNDGRDIPCVVEYLFAVTKNTETGAFLREWNDLAEFCERNRFFVHEGYAMGLAAQLTGFPVEQYDFRGLRFFDARKSQRIDVPSGAMTMEEYDALNATIDRFKKPLDAKPQSPRIDYLLTVMKTVQTHLRYLRVRLFGLNLLDF